MCLRIIIALLAMFDIAGLATLSYEHLVANRVCKVAMEIVRDVRAFIHADEI